MNRFTRIVFLSISLLACVAFLAPSKKLKIWMIGDSTMANKDPRTYPENGWGMAFGSFFNDDVKVDNRAQNGRSTKSFINEKRWQAVMDSIQPGDYVFIEFGHNDEKVEKPTVGTTLDTFRLNLCRFVNETRAKKAFPVLLTPTPRRSFKEGILQDTHGGYPGVTKHVADSLKVPLIDMLAKGSAYLTSLGDEPSKVLFNYVDSGHVNYPKGKKDDTHFSGAGAKKMAGFAAEGVSELKLGLASYLKK